MQHKLGELREIGNEPQVDLLAEGVEALDTLYSVFRSIEEEEHVETLLLEQNLL